MASTRTVRVIATVASVPLAFGLLGGVAHAVAANDAGANAGPDAALVSAFGTNVGDGNKGNHTTTQQTAAGPGAQNQNNTASVNESPFSVIDQSNTNVEVNYLVIGG